MIEAEDIAFDFVLALAQEISYGQLFGIGVQSDRDILRDAELRCILGQVVGRHGRLRWFVQVQDFFRASIHLAVDFFAKQIA